ncbi:MAG TPA: histidine phosphatase family protein [Chloroflexota bacterium]|nr:histidine phosphatase family protein [Chloroflexota bacterium]
MAAYHPSAIVCSVEPKARETGALVAAHLGIGYEVDAGMHEHERQTAGYLAVADFHATIERLFAQPDSLVFGEETARQAQDRFVRAVEQAAGRYPQETIAIVAHGTVIALFAARHAGIDPFPLWQQLGLPSFVTFVAPKYRLAAMETAITSS